jgi:hypothetical protein
LGEFADRTVIEFDFDVRKALLGDQTDELSLDWIEVDSLYRADHGSYQTEIASLIEELAIVGVFKRETSQSASS